MTVIWFAPNADTARDTIPTYADKCPTSIGDEPPLVADVEVADIVEDTIELYVLVWTIPTYCRRTHFATQTVAPMRAYRRT